MNEVELLRQCSRRIAAELGDMDLLPHGGPLSPAGPGRARELKRVLQQDWEDLRGADAGDAQGDLYMPALWMFGERLMRVGHPETNYELHILVDLDSGLGAARCTRLACQALVVGLAALTNRSGGTAWWHRVGAGRITSHVLQGGREVDDMLEQLGSPPRLWTHGPKRGGAHLPLLVPGGSPGARFAVVAGAGSGHRLAAPGVLDGLHPAPTVFLLAAKSALRLCTGHTQWRNTPNQAWCRAVGSTRDRLQSAGAHVVLCSAEGEADVLAALRTAAAMEGES